MPLPEADILKLENQLCFSLYTASRLVTRQYQPLLKQYGLTYPQYLVLLILWEQDNCPVSYLTKKSGLNSNTLTPLLKRMEQAALLHRVRNPEDERQCLISLSDKGKELKQVCACIPAKLLPSAGMDTGQLRELKMLLDGLISKLDKEG